uniref:Tail protein n=1 Tax=Siphoviridae sp. ctnNB1 TaxID=2825660 RepID=A0A8S5UV84_9CAUD|nr:MAG TPA: tail protein [Siphoviridae sp. ctnNB1]
MREGDVLDFYFVNHNGKKVDFSDFPYIFQEGDLLDWVYTYQTTEMNGKNLTSNYRKNAKEFSVKLAVVPDIFLPLKERWNAWKEAVDELVDTFEVDVTEQRDGKLWTDSGFYLACKIVGSSKSNWKMGVPVMFNNLTVLADNPVWIKEESKTFMPQDGTSVSGDYLDYPYDYAYDYTGEVKGSAKWLIDHFGSSQFNMKIFGYVNTPKITINGHLYQVNVTINDGDYLEIDSRDNSIILHRDGGIKENMYYMRYLPSNVFEPIPSGLLEIETSGTFLYNITLFLERSEPRWS